MAEEELKRSWRLKMGTRHELGLEAELAKLRAAVSAKEAHFRVEAALRILRAVFHAWRMTLLRADRFDRRFTTIRVEAAKRMLRAVFQCWWILVISSRADRHCPFHHRRRLSKQASMVASVDRFVLVVEDGDLGVK